MRVSTDIGELLPDPKSADVIEIWNEPYIVDESESNLQV